MKLMIWIPATALAVTLAGCGTAGPAAQGVSGTPASAPRAHADSRSTTSRVMHGDEGTVTGTFTRVGGPLGVGGKQPSPVPLRGTVTFAAGRHRMVAVQVGASGRFSVRLPAGTYVVSGRSPSIVEVLASGLRVDVPCTVPATVTVAAGHTVHAAVVCPVP